MASSVCSHPLRVLSQLAESGNAWNVEIHSITLLNLHEGEILFIGNS